MATRNLEEAREAYKTGNVTESIKAHDQNAATEKHKVGGDFIKSAVFGGLDGICTVFAIVAGGFGSNMAIYVILILGVSTLIGDAIAMSVGDYMGTKSEIEFQKAEREREEWEVENNPEGEKLEMEEIYVGKGISPEDARLLVETFSKNPKTWVDIMMVEELGLLDSDESPIKNAMTTFGSFMIFGFLPLIPYIAGVSVNSSTGGSIFGASVGLAGGAMFLLGAIKSRFVGKNFVLSGAETLLMGTISAGTAYLIGLAFEPLMN